MAPAALSWMQGWACSEAAAVPVVHLAVTYMERFGEVSAGIVLGGRGKNMKIRKTVGISLLAALMGFAAWVGLSAGRVHAASQGEELDRTMRSVASAFALVEKNYRRSGVFGKGFLPGRHSRHAAHARPAFGVRRSRRVSGDAAAPAGAVLRRGHGNQHGSGARGGDTAVSRLAGFAGGPAPRRHDRGCGR